MTPIRRLAWTVGIILSELVLSSCSPPEGTLNVANVPYVYQQQTYYCAPASIQMWHDWKLGPSPTATKEQIWTWMATNCPGHVQVGSGADSTAIAAAATNFLNENISKDFYNTSGVLLGPWMSLTDALWGVTQNHPTIVSTQLQGHAIVVKGGNWHRLADYIHRPELLYVLVNDPGTGLPDEQRSAGLLINFQLNIPYSPDCYHAPCGENFAVAIQYGQGDYTFDQFNAAGGLYYGDKPQSPTGRYRYDGNGDCYWDSTDSGPDQCSTPPPPTGRFKWDANGNCTWDPNDSGPDQCTPTSGRFKIGPDGCYWDPNDSGPDQCSPELLVKHLRKGEQGTGYGHASLKNALSAFTSLVRVNAVPASMRNGHAWSTRSPMVKPSVTSEVMGGGSGLFAGQRQTVKPPADREGGPQVPYPNATKPAEILANIALVARETELGQPMGLDALKAADTQLRARRILDVKSQDPKIGPDYYLVELDDLNGSPYARLMVTKAGIVDACIDERGKTIPRSPDLAVASAKVQKNGLGRGTNARYVYALSAAQPGSPVYMPLVAIDTPKGTVYFNTNVEPFAEAGSQLHKEASSGKVAAPPFADSPYLLQLRLLDRWQPE
jgi:hypothetical protein